MEILKKKTLLKLSVVALLLSGVVALLLFAGVAPAAAMKGNSTLVCASNPGGFQTCTANDLDGIVGITVWNKDTGKNLLDLDYHHFAPTWVDFTIPGTGNFTVELKDNQKKKQKDFFIVDSSGVSGPFTKKPKDP